MIDIKIDSMGLNTDHQPGEYVYYAMGLPCYSFLQMLTPTYVQLGNKIERVEPMGCIIEEPNTERGLRPVDENGTFRNNWLRLTGSGVQKLLSRYSLTTNKIYYPESSINITDCLRMIFQEYLNPKVNSDEMVQLILRQIFIYLNQSEQNRKDNHSSSSAYYDPIMQVRMDIYNQLTRNWKVDDIAKSLNMSTAWFNVLYQKQFGISPKQDILRARIDTSKRLLSYTNMPLREIAQMTGFQNEYYFNRMFSKNVGMTPGEYRKQHFFS